MEHKIAKELSIIFSEFKSSHVQKILSGGLKTASTMRKKKFPMIDELADKASIKVAVKVKKIHPVVENLVYNLADLQFIDFIRITPEDVQASSELTSGRVKIPITKPDHPTAIGVHLIIHEPFTDIQFYEITSAVKGCGGKIVDAIIRALPDDWRACILMDWSRGFWEKMMERHDRIEIL